MIEVPKLKPYVSSAAFHTEVIASEESITIAKFYSSYDGIEVDLVLQDGLEKYAGKWRNIDEAGAAARALAAYYSGSCQQARASDPLAKWRKPGLKLMATELREFGKLTGEWAIIVGTKKGYEDTFITCKSKEEATTLIGDEE